MNSNTSKEYASLVELLNAHRIPQDNKTLLLTHTGYENEDGMLNGRFHVPQGLRQQLHFLLSEAVFQQKQCVTLVERPDEAGPFRVDLDIKYTTNSPTAFDERVYGGGVLDTLLGSISTAVQQCLVLNEHDRKQRLLYVFEKPAPTLVATTDDGQTEWKDGLHIMMPNIITTPDVQHAIRRTVLNDVCQAIQHMQDGGFNVTNTAEDIYDEAVIERNGWLLYGCRKANRSAYTLSSVWHAFPDDLHKYTTSDAEECEDAENVDEHPCWHIKRELKMWKDKLHLKHYTNRKKLKNAPLFVDQLSIRGYTAADETPCTEWYHGKQRAEQNERKKQLEQRQKSDPHFRYQDDARELSFAKRLVSDCLSQKRAEQYNTWIQVGWALHNIHNADKELFDVWVAFSRKSDRHRDTCEDECRKEWANARNKDDGSAKLTMGSLCKWAEEDNLAAYKACCQHRLADPIKTCCDVYLPYAPPKIDKDGNAVPQKSKPKSWDSVNWYFMEVAYRHYGNTLVCSSYLQKTWWEFRGHRWTSATIGLRNFLSEDMYQLFTDYANTQSRILATLPATDQSLAEKRANCERRCEAAKGIAAHTRNTLSKSKVISEACERFFWGYRAKDKLHERQFETVLDENLFLVGLENGIYDLKQHCFRAGTSEDYVSRNTGNCWFDPSSELSDGWSHPHVVAINTFLSQVLPSKAEREYVLTLLASFLDGRITELFHIFVGCGGNGKSKLLDLFLGAMGQSSNGTGYCGNLAVTALTSNRAQSSACTPEFERLRGMRFVTLQEPNQKETIQAGRLKELTGGDTIQARGLYKEPIEFKPQFGMIMASNVLPNVPGDDGGVWRRMRVVRFRSRFRHNPATRKRNAHGKDIDPNPEFPIDTNLTTKLLEWKEAFFWVLTRYYKVYVDGDNGAEPILHYEDGEERAQSGLRKCKSVEVETQRYQSKNDPINEFIIDNVNIKPAHPDSRVAMDVLWTRYSGWCKQRNVPADMDELRNAMELRFDVMVDTCMFRGWHKIAVYSDAEKAVLASGGEVAANTAAAATPIPPATEAPASATSPLPPAAPAPAPSICSSQ